MVTIIPVMVIVYGMSSLIIGTLSTSFMKSQVLEHSQHLSRSYADHLESRITQYLHISEDLSSAVITSIHIETTLKAYKKRYPLFSMILYTTDDGRINDMIPFSNSLVGMDMSTITGWEDSKKEEKPVLSSPEVLFGTKSVVFFAPVLLTYVANQEPDFAGVVALVLPLSELFKDISSNGENLDSLIVIDSRGTILHYKNRDLILAGTMDDIPSLQSLSGVSEAMMAKKTGFAAYSDREGRKYISFMPIAEASWSLGVMGSYSAITAEIRKITLTSFFVIFLGILAGAVIMYFAVHPIVRPIEDLTIMAQKIADGDKTIQSNFNSDSEVGQLSHSINTMVFQLREHHFNLENIVDERTMELKRTNDELGETIEELNTANTSLQETRQSLETRVRERTLELQKAHNYIDNIINSMPSVIVSVTPEGFITHWNKQAEEKTGVPGEKALGQPLEKVLTQISFLNDRVKEAIEFRKEHTDSNYPKNIDGKMIYEDITVYPLTANGNDGAVIRIDDVTHRVLLEESLRQSQKQEVIGQLAGGIAHDFNNMLGGILGGAELLKSMLNEDPDAEDYLSMIIDSAKRAADLTGKLLIFSRRDMKDFSPIDAHESIEGAVALLERSLDKSIKIRTELNASASVVLGDFTQLQNVIMNLGINAAHAMPQGGSLIFKSRNKEFSGEQCALGSFLLEPGRYLEIMVQDNGAGIDAENMERIFEPFFTTKEEGFGTGLGLAAVYSAMELHKGAVIVESHLGQGSTFRLFLPLIRDLQVSKAKESSFVPGKGCILVVDDEEILRMTNQALLSSLGYTVLLGENGKQGLEIYKRRREEIDLVILDMIMPEMNGRDTFAAMKEINPKVRAILVSGFPDESNVNHFIDLGFYAFLQKPVEGALLSRVVAEAITGNKNE